MVSFIGYVKNCVLKVQAMGNRAHQMASQDMVAAAKEATVNQEAMEAVAREEAMGEAVAMTWDQVIINRLVEVLRGHPMVVEAVKVIPPGMCLVFCIYKSCFMSINCRII